MAAPHELVAVTAFGDAILHAFPAVVVFASLAVAVIASPVVEHPFVLSPCGLVDLPPGVVVADLI